MMNYLMDPSGQNSSKQIYMLATQQQIQHTLISENAFDQRQWVRGRLLNGKCPETLILGSSTIGLFSESMFKSPILNLWMGSPSIEDYEAISQILNEAKCTPKFIIMGLDPWFFNKASASDRWKSIYEYYLKYGLKNSTLKMKTWKFIQAWSRFKDNLSFITTRESIRTFLSHRKLTRNAPQLVQATMEDICTGKFSTPLLTENSYLRGFDGHYKNCDQYLPNLEQVDDISNTYLRRNMHGLAEWEQVDRNTMKRLKTLFERFRQKSIQMIVVIPTYHPRTHEILMNNATLNKNLKELDTELLNICDRLGIKFYHFRDSKTIPCTKIEFIDSHHTNETCSQKIVELIGKDIK
jgi:hypothetical protein